MHFIQTTKGVLVFLIAFSVSLESCKSRSSNKLKDVSVIGSANTRYTIGLDNGIVKYRQCNESDKTKMIETGDFDGGIVNCSDRVINPNNESVYFEDVDEALYKSNLCRSMGFSDEQMDKLQRSVGQNGIDSLRVSQSIEEIQAKINSRIAPPDPKNTWETQLAAANKEKTDLENNRATITKSYTAMGKIFQDCTKLMNEWVKPPEKLVDDYGKPVSRVRKTLYHNSDEYPDLVAPFFELAKTSKTAPKVNSNPTASSPAIVSGDILTTITFELPIKDKKAACDFKTLSVSYNINDWYIYWMASCRNRCRETMQKNECVNYRMLRAEYKSKEKSGLSDSPDRCDIEFEIKCR